MNKMPPKITLKGYNKSELESRIKENEQRGWVLVHQSSRFTGFETTVHIAVMKRKETG